MSEAVNLITTPTKPVYFGRNEVANTLLKASRGATKVRVMTGNRMVAAIKSIAKRKDPITLQLQYPTLAKILVDNQIDTPEDPNEDDDVDGVGEAEAKAGLVSEKIINLASKEIDQLYAPNKRLTFMSRAEKIIADNKFQFVVNYEVALLIQNYRDTLQYELYSVDLMKRSMHSDPMWQMIMKAKEDDPTNFVGVGDMAIAAFSGHVNFLKAYYVSHIIKYAGLDVVIGENGVGRGRGRILEHLIDREYVDVDGNVKSKKSITFNPTLKTILVGITATNMIMLGAPNKKGKPASRHYTIYTNYKNRITQRENLVKMAWERREAAIKNNDRSAQHKAEADITALVMQVRAPLTPAHINNMSKRYMIRRLIVDIYNLFVPEFSNLEWKPPYEEGKLGIIHHGSEECAALAVKAMMDDNGL